MDYDIHKSTRTCATSGREIAAGETFYSVLVRAGAEVQRLDYSTEAWSGPPAEAIGWWKSVMDDREAKKPKLAPSEVLLELFRELEGSPERADLRYVLSLLLVRRRLLRLEDTIRESPDVETMAMYCPRDEQTYRVKAVVPDERRTAEIQDYLAQLLYVPASE